MPRSPSRPGAMPASSPSRLFAKALLSALAILIAAGCSPTGDAPPPVLNDGPLIRMAERRWDFGRMDQYVDSVHVFRFRNEGTAPLRITDIDTACGCTAVAPVDSVIAPGASSALTVTFSSGSFEGPQMKFVVLTTNDPAEPRIDLVIQADVRPLIRVELSTLDFEYVRLGETPIASTLLESDPGDPFTIAELTGADDHIVWTVRPEANHRTRVEARLRPDAPLGAFNRRVDVKIRHSQATRVRLQVTGVVYSYFRPEASRINFATVRAGRDYQGKIRILGDGSRSYRILDAEASAPFLRPAVTEQSDGYELAVALLSTGAPPSFRERVILKTDDPSQAEIAIEVVGRVVP